MKEMAEQMKKRKPSMSFQYDDTEDSVMQEIKEQATRKKMEEEDLQARLKKMDAVERQNVKKKKRKEKKIQKKQQKCETQKKAAERKMEELDEAADYGMSTIPQRKNGVSDLEADKETNNKINVIHASRPTAINKESKSGMHHFTPNYVPSWIKTESRSSIMEKQFNIGEKSSVMFLDNPPKGDPIAATRLQHHLKKYEELMKVQPALHTEQQLKMEREQLHLEQIHKDQEELEKLQEKQDNNVNEFGRRSPGGSLILPEFSDKKQLEKLRQEHLQKQRHLELLRNQEEAYEIQQSRLQQLRQQKIKQEAPKQYQRDLENASNCPQNPSTRTPGKAATLPVVDMLSVREIMQEKKQLEKIVPKSQEDEEEMLKQALEISKMTAKEEQERLYKRVAKKGESNTTMKSISRRSTLVPILKLQDLGGLQSIWDIEVSKPSPSHGSTSVSHNPASHFSPTTYAEAVKPKSTGPSWTLPFSPPSSSSLNTLPSPTYAERVKPKPISPVSCPSLTAHSEQGIISRQQSVGQCQNEIHPIANSENKQGHVALNCNNLASSFVESTSKMGSWARKPWDHQLDFGRKYSRESEVSVMPPRNLCNGEKQNSGQSHAPLAPPGSFSSQQRPISSRLPYAIHTRQKQEEGTQIYSDEKVSQASVRVEAINPSLDTIKENDSYIHTVSMSTGSATKFSPSFCGKQPEYSIRQQDPIPQKTHTAVEPSSKVERQEIIGPSFCNANAIVFPTVQNVQHNMEVDVQSAKVNNDRKMTVEDWDVEVDEVIAKRKPFIEDLGKGKKKLWSCYSVIQEKMVFPCRKDFASVLHEFNARKEKQEPKLCGGGPDNAEHKSDLCQKEDLVKESSMSGYCGSASASRRVNTVGKGGFKQKQSNRNPSELNKNQSRMHKNKECDTVTWSSTKSEFKRFPEETSLPARETNDLDRNKLKKNFSDCDTTDLSPHAHSTCSCQEPRTIPPSIQQNNVPTKQTPLRHLGKPIPLFLQTECWDDEIDSVPYIQVDIAPKEAICNGEYLHQDMLANKFSCILNMEETASKIINNKTTAKRLDAQEMHDSFTPHNGSSSENKRLDTEIGHADVMSRFQIEIENINCSLLESNQFLPRNNFAANEKGDRLSPTRLPHFSKFLNVTSAMSLGPTFITTEPKTTSPDFIQMNSIVTEPSKDQTSESKTLNGQTDSNTILEETEATNDSGANFLNPLPSGLPPNLVQAYLQYVALTGLNSVKMAPACLMPGVRPNLGIKYSPFCPNTQMYPVMPPTSPVFSYSLQQQLQHQRQQQAQQHEGSVNEKSNESLSQLKTEIGNIAANQQYNLKIHDARDCPLMQSDKVSQIEDNQSSAAIYFDDSQSEAKMQVDGNQNGKAMHVDNNKSTNLTLTQSRNQIKSNSGCLENGGHLIQIDSNRNNNDSKAKPKTDGSRPFQHPRLALSKTRMCDIKNSSSENSSNTCSENDSQDSDRKNSLPPGLHHKNECKLDAVEDQNQDPKLANQEFLMTVLH